ncbi:MAG: hypothetical protein WC763_02405 [Candidatus Paceibacterota bacterium]|jgi:hypothetical protein
MKIKYCLYAVSLVFGVDFLIGMNIVADTVANKYKGSQGVLFDIFLVSLSLTVLCLFSGIVQWISEYSETPHTSGIYEFLMKVRAPEYDALAEGVTLKGDWQSDVPLIFREREISGIVCDEEVVGVVERQRFVVTVSTKRALRMFRRCAGPNVIVVDVSSFT